MKCWNPTCGRSNDPTASFCVHCSHPDLGFPPPLRFNDNFIVERYLGHGNFGNVYGCRDEVLGRPVAVKHLAIVPAERLRSELQTIASINHPNVVQIYQAKPTQRFFVMEYVDGGTLENLIQSDLESLRQNFSTMAIGICEGLKAAHLRHICHRDIKPENILLSSDGTPKISDFGLAKSFTTVSPLHTPQIGTPYYMAPEIWSDEEYDLTVDIYSLGVLFYRIWTGQYPFEASTIHGLSLKICVGKYEPPENRNPSTPRPICDLIQRMITPKAERIQSIEFVLSELRALQAPSIRGIGEGTIDDMQRIINSIYGYRNYRRSPLLILTHASTNVSGLIGGLRHPNRDYGEKRLAYYFPRSFAWICAFLSQLNWEPSDIIWYKYPGICPYCNQHKCSCPSGQIRPKSEVNEELLRKIHDGTHEKAPRSQPFSYYQRMFAGIYGERNQAAGLDDVCLHMFSEIDEVRDALLKIKSLEELQKVDILHLEAADLIAWFMAILNLWNPAYDFEATFYATFPGRCYLCNQSRCRCPDVEDEIRLASWRYFTS